MEVFIVVVIILAIISSYSLKRYIVQLKEINYSKKELELQKENLREEIKKQEDKLSFVQNQIFSSNNELVEANNTLADLNIQIDEQKKEILNKQHEFNILSNRLETEEKRLDTLQNSYKQVQESVQEALDLAFDEMSNNCDENIKAANETFLNVQEELTKNLQKDIDNGLAEIKRINSLIESANEELANQKSIIEAVIKAKRRENQEQAKKDFYKLIIPEADKIEIQKIKDVIPFIRDKEILNKLIWTTYYQKPYKALIARLFGTKEPCGIYKITSLLDGQVYIGQSVSIPSRWSDHIKRGLGAEPATKNKLYPEMERQGIENFTFELLEEVPKDKLNEREKFYIEFYHSNEVGLNAQKGNG